MKIISIIKKRGVVAFLYYLYHWLVTQVKTHKNLHAKDAVESFRGKVGLEIGGPSKVFSNKGSLPIYPIVKSIDNVIFSKRTIWTGDVNARQGYRVAGKKIGKQFIMDATRLESIKKETYDFVISSHNLEHIANPLKAIEQFDRVLKPEGIILIVVPRKESNFDHKRSVAKYAQLVSNYKKGIGEDDLSNLDEILSLHDLRLDLSAGDRDSFVERSLKNEQNRCLHQFVYDINILEKMLNNFKFTDIKTYSNYINNVIWGRKQ